MWWASASRATHSLAVANSTRAGLASADRQPDREVSLPGPGRAEEDHVLLRDDEVQRAQVGDQVALEAAGVVEVELLQALACGEPGGPDPALPAVGLPGRDLALQAGDQELLMGPGLRPRPLGQPRDCLPQRGRLQRPGQEGHLAAEVALRSSSGLAGGHDANPPSRSMPRSIPRAVS
jgi:hypothetical protein